MKAIDRRIRQLLRRALVQPGDTGRIHLCRPTLSPAFGIRIPEIGLPWS